MRDPGLRGGDTRRNRGGDLSSSEWIEVRPLRRLGDERGWFLKVIQSQHLGDRPFGEVYLSVGSAGETRACHYHEQTTEWFCPVGGRGTLFLYEVAAGRRMQVRLDAENPVSVRVPPGVAHALVAGDEAELAVLAVADVAYDPDAPDTIPMDFESIRGDTP